MDEVTLRGWEDILLGRTCLSLFHGALGPWEQVSPMLTVFAAKVTETLRPSVARA